MPAKTQKKATQMNPNVHPNGVIKSQGNAFDVRAKGSTTAAPPKKAPPRNRGKTIKLAGSGKFEGANLVMDRNGNRTVKLDKNVHTTTLVGSR